MAPLTCKVVDAVNRGQPGVYVMLECKDHLHRNVTTLEARTGEDGGINAWFPAALSGQADEVDMEPLVVDSNNAPRVSFTFFPHTTSTACPASFLSVHADLHLQRDKCHTVILHLDPNPRLEHCSFSATGPPDMFEVVPVRTAGQPQQDPGSSIPSPLLLPPPLSPESRASLHVAFSGGTESHSRDGKRGKKRNLEEEDDTQTPNKKRCCLRLPGGEE